MFRQIFANIPDVTKNLLIINALFFLAMVVLEGQGIYLGGFLGMHYPGSNYFEPYQIITHFFMHGDLMHVLFNMVGLVVFGSQLERTWGKKRFFVFYFVTALGAAALHFLVQGIEVYQICGEWFPDVVINTPPGHFNEMIDFTGSKGLSYDENTRVLRYYYGNVVGASGAVYGLIMAFALLFPNTEFRLLFPPITLKAKWLALILGGIALYSAYQDRNGDSVAHFAHLGGMLFGFIMIQIWKRDKSNFY
jgi:membrane associated rhomboid family serine protease